MEELKKLNRIRGGLNSAITQATKDFDEFLHAANPLEIQAKRTVITTTHNNIQAKNDKIY